MATFGGAGPYLGTWVGVTSHVQAAAMVLFTILLLRFFLVFPKPKRVSRSRLANWAIYGAWVLFLACLVLELIFHPALYHTFGSVGSLLTLGYCILALAALTHTVVRTPRRDLRESGVGLILIGLLAAIGSMLIGAVALVLRFNLPGARYFPLMLVAIPLTMALAVRKQAGLGEAQAG